MTKEHKNKTLNFDVSSIYIDEEETQKFLASKKSQETGSNTIRIGYDKDGKKVILKTSMYFKKPGTASLLTRNELLIDLQNYQSNQAPEEFILGLERNLMYQASASRLAAYLGIPVPKSEYTVIEQTPYLVSEFIPNLEDKGYGDNLDLDRGNHTDLTVCGIFKFLVDQNEDDGQYLQSGDGQIYLTDIAINPNSSTSNSIQALLKEILAQGGLIDIPEKPITSFHSPLGYFVNNPNQLHKQIEGLNSEKVKILLSKLNKLNQSKILELCAIEPDKPTEEEILISRNIETRAQNAARIFQVLSQNINETIIALNPRLEPRKRLFSKIDLDSAREFLLSKLT